ncbi:pyridoxamine 5'-phosphate oxidase family protein [Kitasatospora sp. NPDC094016]|uniref:pyridoxamine 5'-phosphate oxidase family protein n=1 Tax=Kitasatospora sp. NPDC094016 TaxID=3154986 RepID=UPI0033174654
MSGHLKRTKETADLAAATAVLKQAYVCTLAHVDPETGGPRCVPMVYAYHEEGDERRLYLHGSVYWPPQTELSPSLRQLWNDAWVHVCLAVTVLDGLLVGRAAISTSLNYRSVVVDGIARTVDPADRAKAFEALSNQVIPGRWPELRPIKDGKGGKASELDSDKQHTPTVGVLSISLTENTTVVRLKRHHAAEPEHENQEDRDWDHGNAWGGVLPMRQVYGPAIPDSHVKDKQAAPPDSVQRLIGRTT